MVFYEVKAGSELEFTRLDALGQLCYAGPATDSSSCQLLNWSRRMGLATQMARVSPGEVWHVLNLSPERSLCVFLLPVPSRQADHAFNRCLDRFRQGSRATGRSIGNDARPEAVVRHGKRGR